MKNSALAPLFSLTLLLSAFLLFSVQPLVSKTLLPLMGGSPSVWNTSMVFFQAMLLLGYAYAHISAKFFSLKLQAGIQIALLVGFSALRPLLSLGDYTPPESGQTFWQLGVMLACAGGPFFALAASAPLLQHWFSQSGHKDAHSPYFLYAISNVGSLAALLMYPTVIEPMMTLMDQKVTWLYGLAGLVPLTSLCAILLAIGSRTHQPAANNGQHANINWRQRGLWLLLAFVPSSLMLGVTTYITTDLASVPMLWIVPLALYLLSFIIAFSNTMQGILPLIRKVTPYFLIVLAVCFLLTFTNIGFTVWLLVLHLLVFFIAALFCHMELSNVKPPASGLTEFYMIVSAGGVLGGIFNALLAPVLFNMPIEYALVACVVPFLLWKIIPKAMSSQTGSNKIKSSLENAVLIVSTILICCVIIYSQNELMVQLFSILLACVLCCVIYNRAAFAMIYVVAVIAFQPSLFKRHEDVIYHDRNYFGSLKVTAYELDRFFLHGTTLHGSQFLREDQKLIPVTYYSPEGPAGDMFKILDKRGGEQYIAALGLGVGSVACYVKEGRKFDFYEIDRDVLRIAENPKYFQYLRFCGSPYSVTIGDARLKLAQAKNNFYDLIFVDTFSSDNIPIHMMTKEAFEIYLQKLKPDGIIGVNISNRYLDLSDSLNAIARDLGLSMHIKYHSPKKTPGTASFMYSDSVYALITRSDNKLELGEGWRPGIADPDLKPWTDNYANIFSSLIPWKSWKNKKDEISEEALRVTKEPENDPTKEKSAD